MKTTISEMQNTMGGINGRLHMQKNITELKDETIQLSKMKQRKENNKDYTENQ